MNKNRSHGFTLLEVIMTMAIAAIVLSIGVPSFQASIKNNRKVTAVSDLRTALALARNTAVARRMRVTVCKSTDASSNPTSPTCDSTGDWKQGWMIFTDQGPNAGTLETGAGEEILRVHGKLAGGGTFTGNGTVANRVSFKPQGMADGSIGIITYADGAAFTSALDISFGGMVRSQ